MLTDHRPRLLALTAKLDQLLAGAEELAGEPD